MSADFLSRVRAEALRRIEEERFEAAVVAEMKNIRHEALKAEQSPLYRAFHEERKVKLLQAWGAGRITPTVAEIETAISGYVLGETTLDNLYVLIEAVDRDYPHKYAKSPQGRMISYPCAEKPGAPLTVPELVGLTRPGVPHAFQLYLERACGIGAKGADSVKARFNAASMAAVN